MCLQFSSIPQIQEINRLSSFFRLLTVKDEQELQMAPLAFKSFQIDYVNNLKVMGHEQSKLDIGQLYQSLNFDKLDNL